MNVLSRLFVLSACVALSACGKKSEAPATADAAVNRMVASMKQNDPSGVWDMLPASYQKDANGLVTEFATRMDADIYNGGAALIGKLENVLTGKKDMILANPQLANSPAKADVEKNYDKVVAIIGIIADSDLSSLDKLKAADIGEMLGSTGADLMKKFDELDLSGKAASGVEKVNEFEGMTAELVEESGDTAKVKITKPGEEPEVQDFVKVEGKWIPKEMADEFGDTIAKAKANLAKMDFSDPAKKQQALMGINMVNGMLDQLDKAKTQEEFQAAIQGMMMMVMPMLMQ